MNDWGPHAWTPVRELRIPVAFGLLDAPVAVPQLSCDGCDPAGPCSRLRRSCSGFDGAAIAGGAFGRGHQGLHDMGSAGCALYTRDWRYRLIVEWHPHYTGPWARACLVQLSDDPSCNNGDPNCATSGTITMDGIDPVTLAQRPGGVRIRFDLAFSGGTGGRPPDQQMSGRG